MNLHHSEMLRILQKFEGYPHLSSKQLKKLRLHHRFIHANRTLEQQELAQEYAEQEVRNHLRAGQSTRYGQVLAWTNVHRFRDIFISRRNVTVATRKVNPQGVNFCRYDKHRR